MRDVEGPVEGDAVRDDADDIVGASNWIGEKVLVYFVDHSAPVLEKEDRRMSGESVSEWAYGWCRLGSFDAYNEVVDLLKHGMVTLDRIVPVPSSIVQNFKIIPAGI